MRNWKGKKIFILTHDCLQRIENDWKKENWNFPSGAFLYFFVARNNGEKFD
jgi:hypothetical protein